MAELNKEIIEQILKDLSGKDENGRAKGSIGVTTGNIVDNKYVESPHLDHGFTDSYVTASIDVTLPAFLTLTITSSDASEVTSLWARYQSFKRSQANGEKPVLTFNVLSVTPYGNEEDEYDDPIYMVLSATNPVIAYTSKTILDLERDDTVSFLIPIEQVTIESYKEEVIEKIDNEVAAGTNPDLDNTEVEM